MTSQDILDILIKKENKNTEYLNPKINRDSFLDKKLNFGSEVVESILNKILLEGKFRLSEKEATNGIHHHHDAVNAK